ncbi:Hypothetical predicted protein [Paramuricea clavata]|uniref:Uncharacterized protein n=1 Tax=Paramuricea clavata TaxID=317549 RepID=A0A6S7G206_PARCT|nr:Hypothetical predicted protein [Paramuricea clavata]
MWFEHLHQVSLNRKKGAKKAASTRSKRKAKDKHPVPDDANEDVCASCGELEPPEEEDKDCTSAEEISKSLIDNVLTIFSFLIQLMFSELGSNTGVTITWRIWVENPNIKECALSSPETDGLNINSGIILLIRRSR